MTDQVKEIYCIHHKKLMIPIVVSGKLIDYLCGKCYAEYTKRLSKQDYGWV